MAKAEEIAAADPNVCIPQQFENPANPRVHYETTARELWRQMSGKVDCFIAAGGTMSLSVIAAAYAVGKVGAAAMGAAFAFACCAGKIVGTSVGLRTRSSRCPAGRS